MRRVLQVTYGRAMIAATAFAFAVGAHVVTAPEAAACGGFFCNNTQPVNQAAERIVFVDHGDDTVTAVVQILYEGPSDRFAWVLPVPSVPDDIGVSSNVAFQRLQNATNPQYVLTTDIVGECNVSVRGGGVPTAAPDDGMNEDDGGVTVEASGAVGPYIWDVISVDPEFGDPATEAIQWLETNNYDLTTVGADLIRPYLEEDMFLIAFRLQSGSDAGEIRPIVMTYDSEIPMIPIKLTAVAANEDMGVLAWVLGDARAIPTNYRSLVLNEAAINWLNPNSNYADVINTAADEAGGQGFVTEMAGSTDALQDVIWGEFEAQNFDSQFDGQRVSWAENPVGLFEAAINNYGFFDGFVESMADIVTLPDGITPEDAVNCFYCYDRSEWDAMAPFDTDAFIDALALNVIEPMAITQALFDEAAYMTRLYTTMSAADMTLDPCFDFNADLEDFSNVHTATRVIQCTDGVDQFEAPWTVQLPQGGSVRGRGQNWPFVVGDDMPANIQIVRASTSGPGEVVTDNTATVTQALEENNRNLAAGAEGGCACSSAGVSSPAPLALLLLGWLWVWRRRD